MAQVVGYVNRARAFMPPGAVPPFIVRYRRGQRAGRPAGVLEPDTQTVGEMQDHGAEPRASAVRHAAGRLGAAAVRRQPADDRGAARIRKGCAAYRISPEEAIAAVNRASDGDAFGQSCGPTT